LLNGLQKFDPIQNRRHAWDIMVFYNLYTKKLPNDYWQAGRHDLSDEMMKIKKSPNKALVAAAYNIIKNQ